MNGHPKGKNDTPNKLSLGNGLRIGSMMSLGMPSSVSSSPIGNQVSVVLMQIMR